MNYELYEIIRDEKGYKNADVAKGTGISPVVFSEWKNGKSVPKRDKMSKIEEFLDVDEYGLQRMTTADRAIVDICNKIMKAAYPVEYALEDALDAAFAERIADNDEFTILKKIRLLDDADKQKLNGYLDAMLDSDKYKKDAVQNSEVG